MIRFTAVILPVIFFAAVVISGFRSVEDKRVDDEIKFTQKSDMKWVDRRLSDLEERIKTP
jgi:hypothetical protein